MNKLELTQDRLALISSDEGGGSTDDSSEDEIREHLPTSPIPTVRSPNVNMSAQHAQVPTISVTAHSPGVLEDSLQQLRRLHVAVQRMRVAPLPTLQISSNRLSASCPSLCKDDSPIDADVSSPSATPTHLDFYPNSRKGSGESRNSWWEDASRRRSWAALEPAPQFHSNAWTGLSASLSSMESEGGRRRHAHSTHSLNEADLVKDFEKVRVAVTAGVVPEPDTNGLVARLTTLHKSVSTPSIVAAVQPHPIEDNVVSDSESEDGVSRRNNKHRHHLPSHELNYLSQVAYQHSEKRRKRGSLFFRKKKDKSRKVAHSWQPATSTGDCDWCARSLWEKPSLYCATCAMTVHQNVCKDYIVECSKSKISKTAVGKSLSSSSSKSNKRSSLSNQNTNSTAHIFNEDSSDHKHDHSNASDDQSSSEYPEAFLTANQLGDEAIALHLGMPEPETWGGGAPRSLTKTLNDREQKRQEHIYELVLTEKHHCLTIRLMQKMFSAGMSRWCGAGQTARMFPRLDELWSLHAALLTRLRRRQRASPVVSSIADILYDAFTGDTAAAFKSAYGEFCARHRDAVEVFKDCCTREPRMARFIRKCQTNPLLRKKGVPECVLFVAQRLTKYPLLLEPLLKTAGDDYVERERLQKAMAGVKEILVDVDNQVAAKEREDRKLEIYHRIDAKSFTAYRGEKFKKSDILQGNRRLKFEGMATLMQGRSKMQTLLVIVLTDCLFFLHDNNNKYTFFTPDNKTGVVSLQKLLVREKAGADGRGLYLICSSPNEPEMFELRVHKPKEIIQWITAIRNAVATCPGDTTESTESINTEERQKLLQQRQEAIHTITEALRAKDKEHALLLEEKMSLHVRMAAATGTLPLHTQLPIGETLSAIKAALPSDILIPDYVRLSTPSKDPQALWQEVCSVVKEALIASMGGGLGAGSGLGRSTSSAGEKHSRHYENLALPRRADTFGGFDNHLRKVGENNVEQHEGETPSTNDNASNKTSDNMEQENRIDEADLMWSPESVLRLQHCIYSLTCIVWQQLTTIHSLETWRVGGVTYSGGSGGAGSLLEEVRQAHARLTAERHAWTAQRDAERETIMHERRLLAKATEELSEQQRDVAQQREKLFRRLEKLQQQQDVGSQEDIQSGTLSPDSSISESCRRKEPKWRSSRASTGSESSIVSNSLAPQRVLPPPQLLSAQNESKATAVAVQPMVKQQLPLKLASSNKTQHTPVGYHRLHNAPYHTNEQPGLVISHTRGGSSPATTPPSAPMTQNNKATRTNTYPKLPEKFRPRGGSNSQQQAPTDEEVIYF